MIILPPLTSALLSSQPVVFDPMQLPTTQATALQVAELPPLTVENVVIDPSVIPVAVTGTHDIPRTFVSVAPAKYEFPMSLPGLNFSDYSTFKTPFTDNFDYDDLLERNVDENDNYFALRRQLTFKIGALPIQINPLTVIVLAQMMCAKTRYSVSYGLETENVLNNLLSLLQRT